MSIDEKQKMDLYVETYSALVRLRTLDPGHEYLIYLEDFGHDWVTTDSEKVFLEKFRPDPQSTIEEAITEFLSKVEDIIIYDYGAPEWSHQNAPPLLTD